ncbi:MAG: transposase, partial [Bacteroidota bacterium]
MSTKFLNPLFPDNFYHIYNWGANKQQIFFSRENYGYFLRNFHKNLDGIASLYAYCLLPNQYHLLLRIKGEDRLPLPYKQGKQSLHMAFEHAFNIYVSLINK